MCEFADHAGAVLSRDQLLEMGYVVRDTKDGADVVAADETIATVGASGGNDETGLYFEMRYQGRAIDPSSWMNR